MTNLFVLNFVSKTTQQGLKFNLFVQAIKSYTGSAISSRGPNEMSDADRRLGAESAEDAVHTLIPNGGKLKITTDQHVKMRPIPENNDHHSIFQRSLNGLHRALETGIRRDSLRAGE
jgi:hypothetical protein